MEILEKSDTEYQSRNSENKGEKLTSNHIHRLLLFEYIPMFISLFVFYNGETLELLLKSYQTAQGNKKP